VLLAYNNIQYNKDTHKKHINKCTLSPTACLHMSDCSCLTFCRKHNKVKLAKSDLTYTFDSTDLRMQ